MKKIYLLIAAVIISILLIVFLRPTNVEPTVESLTSQLNQGKCRFENDNGMPVSRGFFSGMGRRNDVHYCVIDAAKLLVSLHKEDKEVVHILINALKNYRNVDSGDGIIPVRSEIALALGKLGDKQALVPLQEVLDSEDPVILSENGAFPPNYEAPKGTSHEAVRTAINEIHGGF